MSIFSSFIPDWTVPRERQLWVDGKRTDQYIPTGSIDRPYKTIQDALDAATTSDYAIMIMPNDYNISSPLNLKDDVALIGIHPNLTRILSSDDCLIANAVSTQLYSKPRIVKYVPAENFYPVPKVDSVVLCLEVNSSPLVDTDDIDGFLDIVHCGFCAPRKQIHNSLALALKIPSSQILLLLKEANIDPKRRPETLNLQEWKELYRVFYPHRKQILC